MAKRGAAPRESRSRAGTAARRIRRARGGRPPQRLVPAAAGAAGAPPTWTLPFTFASQAGPSPFTASTSSVRRKGCFARWATIACAREVAAAFGKAALPLTCDVSRKADVDGMVRAAERAFGGVDILVNNAGTTHKNQPL